MVAKKSDSGASQQKNLQKRQVNVAKLGSWHNLYFVQAEVELEEGSNKPEEIPEFLREFLLYEVPLTDDRFSNKRLSDVEFASRLYKSLVEKKNGYKKL